MKLFIVTAAALVMASVACAAQKPNIVYILCDDLGYGDIQCLNPERCKIKTPNVDRLAKEGMIFTDAHSSSSVCTPTRYGILTGRYNWRSRLQRGVLPPYAPALIAAERLTVPAFLKQNGYHTAAIGKWHLGWTWPKQGDQMDFTRPIADGPITRGFEYYFGTDVPNYPPYCFIENDRTVGMPSVPLPTNLLKNHLASKPGPALPDWKLEEILPTLTDKACGYIARQAKRGAPFFLYFPLTAPHTPLAPTQEWQGKSGLNSPYADLVMQVDATVGRVLEALDRAGVANSTLVIFTSDNGCAHYIGVKELEAQGHYPSEWLRGYKSDIWDGGHRVPFIVRWPEVVKPGSSCAQLTCLTDLMATCAEITGAKLPENAGEDSFSFLPLLKGKEEPIRETVIHHSIGGLFAIRSQEWKLELCAGSGGWSAPKDGEALNAGLPPLQLYNMISDYKETKNVAVENKKVVEAMTRQLEALVENGRSTPGAMQANDVPVNIRKEINAGKKGLK
jgi:arylsulfatase A-like enzyme